MSTSWGIKYVKNSRLSDYSQDDNNDKLSFTSIVDDLKLYFWKLVQSTLIKWIDFADKQISRIETNQRLLEWPSCIPRIQPNDDSEDTQMMNIVDYNMTNSDDKSIKQESNLLIKWEEIFIEFLESEAFYDFFMTLALYIKNDSNKDKLRNNTDIVWNAEILLKIKWSSYKSIYLFIKFILFIEEFHWKHLESIFNRVSKNDKYNTKVKLIKWLFDLFDEEDKQCWWKWFEWLKILWELFNSFSPDEFERVKSDFFNTYNSNSKISFIALYIIYPYILIRNDNYIKLSEAYSKLGAEKFISEVENLTGTIPSSLDEWDFYNRLNWISDICGLFMEHLDVASDRDEPFEDNNI